MKVNGRLRLATGSQIDVNVEIDNGELAELEGQDRDDYIYEFVVGHAVCEGLLEISYKEIDGASEHPDIHKAPSTIQ